MPYKIIIVRHGQTEYNTRKIIQGHLDIPLDETGVLQAKAAAQLLKNEKIDVFYSSDLQRALKTAETAVAHHQKPLHVTRLLREKHFGTLQGLSFDEISKYVSRFGEQGSFSMQGKEKEFGAESEEEIIGRIKQFKKILDRHEGKTVAVFSHGGYIRRLLTFLGIPKERMEKMHIPNAQPMVLIKKGSTYILEE